MTFIIGDVPNWVVTMVGTLYDSVASRVFATFRETAASVYTFLLNLVEADEGNGEQMYRVELPGYKVDEVKQTLEQVVIKARRIHPTAACPSCGNISQQIHSHYMRDPRDIPMLGQQIQLHLITRRFTPHVGIRAKIAQIRKCEDEYQRMRFLWQNILF